jgi:fibronectin-binding autotransporter adhesin
MKIAISSARVIVLLAAIAILPRVTSAATYTWDADLNSANGASAGSGTWDTPYNNLAGSNAGAASWFSGTGTPDTRWSGVNYLNLNVPANADAVFGGTLDGVAYPYPAAGAYFVTVGNVQANSIAFDKSGYSLSGGAVTLTGSAAISFNNSGATYFSTPLAGTAGVTFSSTAGGTLYLTSKDSHYTGTTTIKSGTVAIPWGSNAGGNTLGNDAGTIYLGDTTGTASATLGLLAGSITTSGRNITVQGNGTGTTTIAAVPGAGSNTSTNYAYGNTEYRNGNIILAHDLVLKSIDYSRLSIGYNGGTASISGAGNLTITGPGRVSLDNANSFTGNITVNGGSVLMAGGGNNSLGSGNPASTITLSSGTLAAPTVMWFTGGDFSSSSRVYTFGSNVIFNAAQSNASTLSGTAASSFNDGGNGFVMMDGGGTNPTGSNSRFGFNGNLTSLTGPITLGNASLTVAPQTSGTTAFGDPNGTLALDNAGLFIGSSASSLTINKGAVTYSNINRIALDNNNISRLQFASLTRSGAGILEIGPTTSGDWVGNTNTSREAFVTGALSTSNGIVLDSSGATSIRQYGTGDFLQYVTTPAVGFRTATYTNASTTFTTSATQILNIDSAQTVAAATTFQVYAAKAGAYTVSAGDSTSTLQVMSGGLNLNGSTINTNVDFNGTEGIIGVFGNSTIAGVVQITATGSNNGVTIFGGSQLTYSGTAANSYTGVTTIQHGTLNLNKIGPSQTASTNTVNAIVGDVNVGLNGTLQESAFNQLSTSTNVTVMGAWNLQNNAETINNLTVSNRSQNYGYNNSGGQVNLGNDPNTTWTFNNVTINPGGQITSSSPATGHVGTITINGTLTMTAAAYGGQIYNPVLSLAGNNGGTNVVNLNLNGPVNMTGGTIGNNNVNTQRITLGNNVSVTTNASPQTALIGSNGYTQVILTGTNLFTVADGPAATDMQIAGQLGGAGNLTKDGPGRMSISGGGGNSPYSTNQGIYMISGGTLAVDGQNSLASNASSNANYVNKFVLDASHNDYDSVLLFSIASYTFGATNGLVVQGSGTGNAVLATGSASTEIFNSPITLNKNLVLSALNSNSNMILNGVISGSAYSLTKIGPGAIYMGVSSPSYGGAIHIQQGTVDLYNCGANGLGTGAIDIGDSSGTADAALLANYGSVSTPVGQNITVNSGSTGVATIGTSGNGSWNFQGNITLNKNVVFNQTGNTMTVTGAISGSGGIAKIGSSTVVYQNLTAPASSVDTVIDAGTLRWQYNQATGAVANVSFGTGKIILNGGTFDFAAAPAAGSGDNLLTLTNQIVVTQAGGALGNEGPSSFANKLQFSGDIALGGMLQINNVQNAGSSHPSLYAGKVTIDQSASGLRGIAYNQSGSSQQSFLTGNVVDGTGAAGNPLVLRMNKNAPFMFQGSAAGNTYAGGTFIEGQPDNSSTAMNPNNGNGTVYVAGTSKLGAGNVAIFNTGRLQLQAAGNVAGAISMASNQTALSVLSLGGDFLPSFTADNGGVLALDTAGNYAQNINLATLGNGKMYLGSIGSQGINASGTAINSSATLTGALSPGKNPSTADNDTYRLGGGGGTLILNGSNALTNGAFNNQLIVGSVAANGAGTVNLTNANDFSGGITVNNNSSLQGTARTSGSPFGSAANVLTLSGGTIQVNGINNTTTTDLGAVTIDGAGTLATTQTNTPTNTFRAASIGTRASTAPYVLIVQPSSTANLGVGKEQVVITSQPAVTAGIVAPYMVSYYNNNADFLNYTGTGLTASGFALPAYTNYTVAGTLTGIGVTAYNANVSIAQTLAAAGETITVNSLRTSASISNGTTASTINVTSGGVISNSNSTIQPTLAFGTAEAVIWSGKGDQTLTVNNLTGSGGLTKTGPGALTLNAATTISGQLSILGGVVGVSNANQLTNISSIYLNGGRLYLGSFGTLSQNITLGNLGGGFDMGSNAVTSTLNGNITDASGAKGFLFVQNVNQGNLVLAGAGNNYSGGTLIGGTGARTVTVNTTSCFGIGDLTVRMGTVILKGNANINSNARVSLTSASTTSINSVLYFQSDSPAIGSLEGSGDVILGGVDDNLNPAAFVSSTINSNADHSTTLTLGGNNASTLFDGTIMDSIGTRAGTGVSLVRATGALTKAGAGTLTLAGASAYSGKTSINAGTLSVASLNSVVGGAASSNLGAPTTAANGAIAIGLAATAGTLRYTGPGETTDRAIDLAGATGGATIDQSGSGLLKFTAANTASGADSKTLILQGSTAGMGEIAGAIIDNSGANKTSLAKSGTGTWTLSGISTYTGATAVNDGKLRVTGSIAGTSGVTVVPSAVLDLASVGGTALAPSGPYTPVTNNGTLNVSSASEKAGAISGIGSTSVLASASLTADSIVQGTLSIGAGATVTIRETTGGGAVSTVPEPGTWVLIGTALLGLLAFRRRQR